MANQLVLYLFIVLGIIISIILPIVKKKAFPPTSVREGKLTLPDVIKPYLWVGLFSLIAALLIFALPENTITDWRVALIAGYSWDSTFQKLGT